MRILLPAETSKSGVNGTQRRIVRYHEGCFKISVPKSCSRTSASGQHPMFTFRPVIAADTPAICRHRRIMFEELGWDKAALDPAMESFALWVAERIAQDAYFGFIVE